MIRSKSSVPRTITAMNTKMAVRLVRSADIAHPSKFWSYDQRLTRTLNWSDIYDSYGTCDRGGAYVLETIVIHSTREILFEATTSDDAFKKPQLNGSVTFFATKAKPRITNNDSESPTGSFIHYGDV
jgi:hypothetical protein